MMSNTPSQNTEASRDESLPCGKKSSTVINLNAKDRESRTGDKQRKSSVEKSFVNMDYKIQENVVGGFWDSNQVTSETKEQNERKKKSYDISGDNITVELPLQICSINHSKDEKGNTEYPSYNSSENLDHENITTEQNYIEENKLVDANELTSNSNAIPNDSENVIQELNKCNIVAKENDRGPKDRPKEKPSKKYKKKIKPDFENENSRCTQSEHSIRKSINKSNSKQKSLRGARVEGVEIKNKNGEIKCFETSKKNDIPAKINTSNETSYANDKTKATEFDCSKILDIIDLRNVRKNDYLISKFSSGNFLPLQRNKTTEQSKSNRNVGKTFNHPKSRNMKFQEYPTTPNQFEPVNSTNERKENYSYGASKAVSYIQQENTAKLNNQNKFHSRSVTSSNQKSLESPKSKFYSTKSSYNETSYQNDLSEPQIARVRGSTNHLTNHNELKAAKGKFVTPNQYYHNSSQSNQSQDKLLIKPKIRNYDRNTDISKDKPKIPQNMRRDALPNSDLNLYNDNKFQRDINNTENSRKKYPNQTNGPTVLFKRDTCMRHESNMESYPNNRYSSKPWDKNVDRRRTDLRLTQFNYGVTHERQHAIQNQTLNKPTRCVYSESGRSHTQSAHQNYTETPPRFQKKQKSYQVTGQYTYGDNYIPQNQEVDTRMIGGLQNHYSHNLVPSYLGYKIKEKGVIRNENDYQRKANVMHSGTKTNKGEENNKSTLLSSVLLANSQHHTENMVLNQVKDRKNSVASDLSSIFSKISDWSLEIEEEDNYQDMPAQSKIENKKELPVNLHNTNISPKRDLSQLNVKGPYTGGLIKLPQQLNGYNLPVLNASHETCKQSFNFGQGSISSENRNGPNKTLNMSRSSHPQQLSSQAFDPRNSFDIYSSSNLPLINKKVSDPGVVWYSSTHPPPGFENHPPHIYIQNYYNQVNSRKIIGSPNASFPNQSRQESFLNKEPGFGNRRNNESINSVNHLGNVNACDVKKQEENYQLRVIEIEERRINEACSWIKHADLASMECKRLETFNDSICNARNIILCEFRNILLSNLKLCVEQEKEIRIWKICFYVPISTLISLRKRSELKLDSSITDGKNSSTKLNSNDTNKFILSWIDDGTKFYTSLIDVIRQTYNINIDKYLDILEPRSQDAGVRCVLISVQNCLLYLGDLERYKEDINQTVNYANATMYYRKASYIDTRNGNPYNRLAILNRTRKRRFEAVYYNMRCLSCNQPIPSSHETLTITFDEVKKRWENAESKRLKVREISVRAEELEKQKERMEKGTHLRKEIWIRPEGGGRRLHRTTSAQEITPDLDEIELKDMSTTDLNRRFNNTFLYIVGKLYTNINMDTFPIAAELLQKEFKVLLSRSPLPIDTKRLVQIMALNMFVIEQTKMKTGDSERYRSVAQNSALQLSFGMFGVLLERCNFLMESFRLPDFSNASNMPQTVFSEEDLPTLLAAVKVWCDWLLGNNDTWFPIVSQEPFNELAKLATHLEKLKIAMKEIIKHFINQETFFNDHYKQENYEMIKLGEDALLCGFNPWFCGLDWSTYRRYAHKSIPQTLAQDVRRLDTINDCIDYLEGHDPPILKWSKPDNAHISLVENTNIVSNVEKVNAKLTNMFSREEDILEEAYSDDDTGTLKSSKNTSLPQVGAIVVEEEGEGVNKIKKLKIRKEELERRKREDEEQSKLQKQILEEHVSVVIEVCPRQVVPDTNCFVDYLSDIKKIALDTRFQLRVPLVVLNELDGLAKGIKNGQSIKHDDPEHVTKIAEKAKLALGFLRDRPMNTKCVTYKGTILPTFGVTTEEDARQGKTNDDLILDTCINLACLSKAADMKPPKDNDNQNKIRYINRDIVLLTGDRNLRLKAHATDIPVNKLSDFIKWAFNK